MQIIDKLKELSTEFIYLRMLLISCTHSFLFVAILLFKTAIGILKFDVICNILFDDVDVISHSKYDVIFKL